MIQTGDKMSFVVDCPACCKAVTVSQDLIGRVMACPHCAKHFSLPAEGAKPVPVATPGSSSPPTLFRVNFTFTCQRCNSTLEGRRDLCGQPGTCPTCGAVFTVPHIDDNTGTAAGPALVADDGQNPTPMHAYATAGSKAPKIRRLETGVQVVVCPRCAAQLPVDADTCSACGIPFTMEGAAAIARTGPETNGYATAALTVGILALLSSCMPVLAPVAIGLGIAGLRRAAKTRSGESGRKPAIAGLICGLGALAVFALSRFWNRLF